jgi:hypothetical protein
MVLLVLVTRRGLLRASAGRGRCHREGDGEEELLRPHC